MKNKAKKAQREIPRLIEIFEAGMIYQNNMQKGNTSLWSDSVSKGYNDFIRKYVVSDNE